MREHSGAARQLATVLFVDIVGSTDRLSAMGDARWVEVLESLDAATRLESGSRGGTVIKTTGDGSLSIFPSPSAAMDCATALHEAGRRIGLALRAGAHAGEIERRGDDVAGLTVHVAARLMACATPGETLVSETVRLLAAGAATHVFEDRGQRRVKGVAEPVASYAVVEANRTDVPVPTEVRGAPGLEQVRRLVAAGRFENATAKVAACDDLVGLAELIVGARARTGFLDVDLPLVRLLEDVLDRLTHHQGPSWARVAAKLAFELRGDAGSIERRRTLLREAAECAAGDDDACCAVGLASLHALWDPAGAPDRLSAADRLIPVARRLGNLEAELEARLALVHALVEVGRVDDAELELSTYARLAAPLKRHDLGAFVASRRALLAMVRGRYDEIDRQAEQAREHAIAAGMPDADRLWATLRVGLRHRLESNAKVVEVLPMLEDHVVEFPGHLFEATLAGGYLDLNRHDEAAAAVARALPLLLRSSGYRWLSAATEAARVAAAVGTVDQCEALYRVLIDKRHLYVSLGPTYQGAVRQYLGPLAARIGRTDEAIEHLERAIDELDSFAALPWAALARASLASVVEAEDPKRAGRLRQEAGQTARLLGMTRLLASLDGDDTTRHWVLQRGDGGWKLRVGETTGLLRPTRGLDHLRTLLANPRHDISALELEVGDAAPRETQTMVLDDQAKADYRRRLAELDAALDAADASGDARQAKAHSAEREQLVGQLRRAVGLGGRDRRLSDSAERARVNVTRALKRAVQQVAEVAPLAGAHLEASIRTGTYCRYDPTQGGPDRWQL